MPKKIAIVEIAFLIAIVLIITRIIYLGFTQSKNIINQDLIKGRGTILDRNGRPLAITYRVMSVYTDPSSLGEKEKNYITDGLSKILGINREEIYAKLNKNSKFVWLYREIPDNKKVDILKLSDEFYKKFSKNGLHIFEETTRKYPLGEKISTVIGKVGEGNRGLSGIEFSLESVLTENGGENVKVTLSIDKYVQEIAYLEIEKAVTEFSAELGIAIVASKNGEILAMVDYPSFNPYDNVFPFNSRAISYILEPGSVMKLASIAFALANYPGIYNKTYLCEGNVNLFGHIIKEKAHGVVSLDDIIAYSCNVGMIKIAEDFNPEDFYKFLVRLGFGEKVGVGIPGEEKGILRQPVYWNAISKYMISIGQEIGVTPIQLLKFALEIANDGKMIQPKLIKNIFFSDGSMREKFYIEGDQVFNSDIAKLLKFYMKSVITRGTGKLAKIDGIEVIGKTGTGQIVNPMGGYFKDRYNSVFIGMLPYDDPKLIGIVILVNPKREKQAGLSAAPTFSSLVSKILAYDRSLLK